MDMKIYEKNVPFDPGYSPLSFSFIENIEFMLGDYFILKTPQQKKFKLMQLTPKINDLIVKNSAFYLGCMLWGGFLSCRFKTEPKEITGNHTLKLSEEDAKDLDCAEETKYSLQFITQYEKDSKYYLNKPAQITPIVKEILNAYNEFAQINGNFLKTTKTNDIKLPKALSHFEKLTDKQLDALHDGIKAIINDGKIEKLLDLGFYHQ